MYYKVEFVKEGTVKNADWEVIDYWNSVCNNNELEAMTHVALKDMNITQYAVKIFSRSVCAGIWDAVEQGTSILWLIYSLNSFNVSFR